MARSRPGCRTISPAFRCTDGPRRGDERSDSPAAVPRGREQRRAYVRGSRARLGRRRGPGRGPVSDADPLPPGSPGKGRHRARDARHLPRRDVDRRQLRGNHPADGVAAHRPPRNPRGYRSSGDGDEEEKVMAVAGTVSVSLALTVAKALDLRTPQDPLNLAFSRAVASGLLANQADKAFLDSRSTSGTDSLDLNGSLADGFGDPFVLARVKLIA